MTEYSEIDARRRGDDKIRRDRFGRYLLPDPETGEDRPWTRATTISATLKDRFALEQWSQRNVAWGIGARPDLYARAAAARREDDDTLAEIVERATEAAAASSGAITGSALHQFAERVDRGEELSIPAPHDADVAAYRQMMDAAGMTVAVGWLERVVCIPELGIAGTLDRLYNAMEWPLPRVGDLKTATDGVRRDSGKPYNKVLDYGMVDIPLQLAIYAKASLWWDGRQWCEMPSVDQERAMVVHLPAGMAECRIYEVDIRAGWEAVLLAMDVRAWRKRKGLAEIVPVVSRGRAPRGATGDGVSAASGGAGAAAPPSPTSSKGSDFDPSNPQGQASNRSKGAGKGGKDAPSVDPPAPGPDPARFAWVRARVEAIKEHSEARRTLAGCWSEVPEIPTFPKGGPRTAEELERIAGFCSLVEMTHELAFPAEDPAIDYSQRPERNRKDH